jgi:hypothetical protein
VERVVQRMEDQRADPCKAAVAEGRPCFPVTTVLKGDEYSVRDSLAEALGPGGPTPGGAPSVTDMKRYRPGSQTPVAGVSFDPGCVGKGILKSLKGKNDVYYLYRLRDRQGVRAALFDHKLEPSTFQGELAFLGRFDGECAAVNALRHEELVHPAPAGPTPVPSPSP